MDRPLVVEPEGERYAADLLLLHGLWARPSLWGKVAVGLAQRGWRCWLLDARAASAADQGVDLAAWRRRAEEAVRGLAAPPIVIGHDAGGLLALSLAEAGLARAAVAVAPLLEGADPFVGSLRRRLARWLGGSVLPPAGGHPCYATLSPAKVAELTGLFEVEDGRLVGSLHGAALRPGAPRVPAVLVAQEIDPVVSRSLVEITARGIEADVLVLPGGHWPMADEGVDAWTTQIHRWIVRRIGREILLLRGDEDLRED
jgi:pimeloyl-ACP methyl ester carboxylesterase